LPFCPDSFELLQDTCPCADCGAKLSWRGNSIIHCHQCGGDLRSTFPQSVNEVDRPIAAWIAALVSTDAPVRERAWKKIPDDLLELGPVALIDLLMTFGALAEDPTEKISGQLLRRVRSGDFRFWTFPMLRAGAQILLDWPSGFFQLVSKMRDAAEARNRGRGRFYLLGALATLANPKESNKRFANVFRPLIEQALARAENEQLASEINENGTSLLISPDEIQERFGLCRPTITKWGKALGMFAGRELSRGRRVGLNRSQFEELMAMRDEIQARTETCNEISDRTRIPVPSIVYLAEKCLIPDAGIKAKILRATGNPVFNKNMVEDTLIARIGKYKKTPTSTVALGTALNYAGFFHDGWAEALEAILRGRLRRYCLAIAQFGSPIVC
jgi:hypothetical protein